MTIAVKYCGGCNPHFERRDIVARLEADFPGIRIVTLGSAPADSIVVICGCQRACASAGTHTAQHGVFTLTRADDYAHLAGALDTLIKREGE